MVLAIRTRSGSAIDEAGIKLTRRAPASILATASARHDAADADDRHFAFEGWQLCQHGGRTLEHRRARKTAGFLALGRPSTLVARQGGVGGDDAVMRCWRRRSAIDWICSSSRSGARFEHQRHVFAVLVG